MNDNEPREHIWERYSSYAADMLGGFKYIADRGFTTNRHLFSSLRHNKRGDIVEWTMSTDEAIDKLLVDFPIYNSGAIVKSKEDIKKLVTFPIKTYLTMTKKDVENDEAYALKKLQSDEKFENRKERTRKNRKSYYVKVVTRVPMSEEHKAKISARMTGDKNHMYGKTHSPEMRAIISAATKGTSRPPVPLERRQRISAALKGRKRPQEVVDAITKANRGKKRSPEIIAKMSKARLGAKHSPETIAKMSKPRKKRVKIEPKLAD